MNNFRLLLVSALAIFVFFSVFAKAEKCTPFNCKLENNCACAKPTSPLGDTSKTPQFVTLVFDGALTGRFYDNAAELLFNRKNFDNSSVSATFYVSHRYTNYAKVNDLYNRGFDIGDNGIGINRYLPNATVDELVKEFLGQRMIISNLANISIDDVRGVRNPFHQANINVTYTAYVKSGLHYDNTWITHSSRPFYPYTLDYPSWPVQSHPGFWIAPIITFVGQGGIECSILAGCQLKGTAEEIRDWFIEQYARSHSKTRSPISISINSGFFLVVKNSFEGLKLFLDYLQTKEDTFVVSHRELMRWSKNPEPLSKYRPVHENRDRHCREVVCEIPFYNETMYMSVCNKCPEVYPWVGNSKRGE